QQIVRLEPGLSAPAVDGALTMSDADWLAVNMETLRILDQDVGDRIRTEDLPDKRAALVAQINTAFSPAQQAVVADMVGLYTRPRGPLLDVWRVGVSLLAMKLVVPGRPWAGYVFPVAVATMLISNLLSPQLAIAVAVFFGLLTAPLFGYSFEMVCLVTVVGIVGAQAARRIERLNAFFLAGFQVMLADLAVGLAF